MAGGKATPKKDKRLKVSTGQTVKIGEILCRGITTYKPGIGAKGLGTTYAICAGTVYFTKKKTSHGQFRTFINVKPHAQKAAK